MDLQKMSLRMDAIVLSDAINGMGGVPVSDFAKELSLKWAHGEITYDEAKSLLIQKHTKIRL